MKRILFLVSILLFVAMSAIAQDLIFMRDLGKRIAATNIKVSIDETTYTKFNDESGKVYSLFNNEISMIAYVNGDVRFFEKEKKVTRRYNYKKNLLNFHLFDLIVNNFKLSYERIISNGKMGIQIPFAVGYGNGISGFDDIRNKFYTGISLNFYPTGQGKVRYFMGPGLQFGKGSYDDEYYAGGSSHPPMQVEKDTFVFRFLVNNGVIFSPIKELSLSAMLALGIRYVDESYDGNDNIKTVGAFSFNLAYRF